MLHYNVSKRPWEKPVLKAYGIVKDIIKDIPPGDCLKPSGVGDVLRDSQDPSLLCFGDH